MPGNKVAIVLGNRETMINATLKAVLGQAYKEIDFHFESATRAGDFIELATRPETRLALFIPPGNIDPEPGISNATVEDEIVRIITRSSPRTSPSYSRPVCQSYAMTSTPR